MLGDALVQGRTRILTKSPVFLKVLYVSPQEIARGADTLPESADLALDCTIRRIAQVLNWPTDEGQATQCPVSCGAATSARRPPHASVLQHSVGVLTAAVEMLQCTKQISADISGALEGMPVWVREHWKVCPCG